MRHRYDAATKWLIETFATQLLRLAGVGPVSAVKPIPSELTQARQLPDGLLEVTYPDQTEPVLYLIEINTYPYARVATELLDDVLLTYLDRRTIPEVIALTLCEKGKARIDTALRVPSRFGRTWLEAGWKVVNLWELNASDFLPLTDPGLAPWVPLMRIDGPPEPVLQQCREVIAGVPEPSRRANLLGVTQILAGLRFDEALLQRLFRLEGSMIESPVIQQWLRQTAIETRQTVVLEAVESRFGTPVPADIAASVRLITDETRLRQLVPLVYASVSLDDFRKNLTSPSMPTPRTPP